MVELSKLINRMSLLPHFKKLSLSDLKTIVTAGRFTRIPAEAVIFIEEEPCSGLYVLLSGLVHLSNVSPDGRETILAIIEPVIMFNEVAALDGGTNPFTAITAKNSLLWHASVENFQIGLKRYPELALGLLPILANRNRTLVNYCQDLAFRSVRARTAKLLLDISEDGRETINRRNHSINQMAARIATVPEAISRSFGYFRDQGYIDSNRTSIDVIQPNKLAELADVELVPLKYKEKA